jgi:hypothetical protein
MYLCWKKRLTASKVPASLRTSLGPDLSNKQHFNSTNTSLLIGHFQLKQEQCKMQIVCYSDVTSPLQLRMTLLSQVTWRRLIDCWRFDSEPFRIWECDQLNQWKEPFLSNPTGSSWREASGTFQASLQRHSVFSAKAKLINFSSQPPVNFPNRSQFCPPAKFLNQRMVRSIPVLKPYHMCCSRKKAGRWPQFLLPNNDPKINTVTVSDNAPGPSLYSVLIAEYR